MALLGEPHADVPGSGAKTRYPTGFRSCPATRKSRLRTKIANGTAVLPDVDGRSLWVRRFREIVDAHVSDLGGADALSAAQTSIVRRVATLTVQIEAIEAGFAEGDREATMPQLDLYQRMSNTLRRLLESIGLERKQRDVTPRQLIDDYARAVKEGAP
jgi:hypothetical protein